MSRHWTASAVLVGALLAAAAVATRGASATGRPTRPAAVPEAREPVSPRADWSVMLPPGPGRDYAVALCSGCHTAGVLVIQRRTRAQWHEHLVGMNSARENAGELCACIGGPLDEEDIRILADYLGEASGPKNPVDQLPLNVNTAPVGALARLPGLTDADVQSIVVHRLRAPFRSKREIERVLGSGKFAALDGLIDVKDSIFNLQGIIPM